MNQSILFFSLFLWLQSAFPLEGHFNLGFATGGKSFESVSGLHAHGMTAGEGYSMSGGVILPISDTKPHSFEAQVGLGILIQFNSDEDKINEVRWTRWPLDFIYYYRNHRNQFRIGYGVTWHLQNRLQGEGVNAGLSTGVNDPLGWVLSLEKLFPGTNGTQITWGIRYTAIDYKLANFAQQIDGSSFLFTLGFNSGKNHHPTQQQEEVL